MVATTHSIGSTLPQRKREATPQGVEADSIGGRVRAVRGERGLSQARLAELSGIHKNTIQRWEVGAESSPQEVQLRSVARVLGIAVSWLRTGDDAEPTPSMTVREDPSHYEAERPQSAIERLRGTIAALQGILAELEALETMPRGPVSAEIVPGTLQDFQQAAGSKRPGRKAGGQ